MLTTALEIVGVLAVLFVAAVLATREGEELAPAHPDRADLTLPEGQLGPQDLQQVRFSMAVRGYRMAEVDMVLARLGQELAARDARIAELERAAPLPVRERG